MKTQTLISAILFLLLIVSLAYLFSFSLINIKDFKSGAFIIGAYTVITLFSVIGLFTLAKLISKKED